MITIFIGTYNRVGTLMKTIDSYKNQTEPHELVIVDNGSDHPGCLAALRQLERGGHVKKVYHLPAVGSMEEATDNFNAAIEDQYNKTGGDWFAVSEADVSFQDSSAFSLMVYVALSQLLDTAVGPHLRANDIPAYYPLRSRVLACENWMQYRRDMERVGGIHYNYCQIDTTFHLFKRRPFFDRLHMDPVRVARPYDAKHSDWYIDVYNPTVENRILIPDRSQLGSWGKSWIRDFWEWFQISPEHAFDQLSQAPKNDHDDLCNVSFILSWCYQYGQGVGRDWDLSKELLWSAIPKRFDRYWDLKDDWMAMIYENDFSSLGWG